MTAPTHLRIEHGPRALGVGFAEHNGHKINILDAPGFFDFSGQVISGLRAAEGAVVVVGPSAQLAVGTEIASHVTGIGDAVVADPLAWTFADVEAISAEVKCFDLSVEKLVEEFGTDFVSHGIGFPINLTT